MLFVQKFLNNMQRHLSEWAKTQVRWLMNRFAGLYSDA